jgi:hypothetical protein
LFLKYYRLKQVPVAPIYNLRQTAGGLWFDVFWGKLFARPYLEKTHHKIKGERRAWWTVSRYRP